MQRKYSQQRVTVPEVITSSEEWMCHQDVVFVVKREVKLDIPEMKRVKNVFHYRKLDN